MGAWGPSSLRHFRALRDVLEFRVEDFRITDFGKVFVVSSGFLVVGVINTATAGWKLLVLSRPCGKVTNASCLQDTVGLKP